MRSHWTWLPRPDRHAAGDHFEAAAQRVAGVARRIDRGDHPRFDVAVDAVQRRVARDGRDILERDGEHIGDRRVANRRDVADDLGAEVLQQLTGNRSDGDARGGLARAGALEHVAHVLVPVFGDAGEVGVAGTRTRDDRTVHAGRFGRRRGFDGHRALPVLPVAVRNRERDRAPGRHAVADAAQRLRAIRFDRHATPAAVPALSPAQLRGDRVEVDGEAGGHAFENHHERGSVRFAGGQKSQH